MEKVEGNIYLVAAYLAEGAKIQRIDRSNERHVKFVVTGINLDEIEIDWLNNELIGNLYTFAQAIRKVKNILYAK